MKPVFVCDLLDHVNLNVTAAFLVRSKETRFKKTGEPYLSLMLGDRTGEVEARMWENVDSAPPFDRDDFLKVKGLVQVFRNRPQISIHKLRRMEESEVEIADFFPRTERDVEQMFAELRAAVAEARNPQLRALLEAVLADPDVAARLKQAPAAKSLHHAYLGGLLEHIVSLCRLCRMVVTQYPSLDADLLLAAAVLHDLGKIRELEYSRSISYSTEGQLLGHIAMALGMVEEKLRALPDFPAPLRVLIEHMILSHHGELEFGSPKTPMFPEALVFHYLDNLDSKVNSMSAQLARDPLVEGNWTQRNPALGRSLLKWQKYLSQAAPAAETAAANDPSGEVAASDTAESPGGPAGPAATGHAETGQTALPWGGAGRGEEGGAS